MYLSDSLFTLPTNPISQSIYPSCRLRYVTLLLTSLLMLILWLLAVLSITGISIHSRFTHRVDWAVLSITISIPKRVCKGLSRRLSMKFYVFNWGWCHKTVHTSRATGGYWSGYYLCDGQWYSPRAETSRCRQYCTKQPMAVWRRQWQRI